MPKEIIHDDTHLGPGNRFGVNPDNSTPLAVEVGWGRDGYVQIGTIDLRAEQYTPERGWFVDVGRGEINKLIRVLRRARDQAYGADE